MDRVLSIYTTFEGRLNRRPFWLFGIGLIIPSLLVSYIVYAIFGVSPFSTMQAASELQDDPQSMANFAKLSRTTAWANLVTFSIMAYPAMALWIKRAHDRASSGMLVYVTYALLALSYVAQGLGLTVTFTENPVTTNSVFGWLLEGVTGLLSLYVLITLGFLKGTKGPNRYGPDPLAEAP